MMSAKFLRLGRGRFRDLQWYDVVITGLALAMVYPDKIVEWLAERTGRELGIRHVVYVEAVAIGLMLVVMALAMTADTKLPWWYPVMHVGMLALFRFLMSVVTGLFGIDEG